MKTNIGKPTIALVGDHDSAILAHRLIPKALALAASDITAVWVSTPAAETEDFSRFQGIWCVPGSPYQSFTGALRAIQIAREKQIPFLGTCGGFQHALIEYARNLHGLTEADHTESNPATGVPLIQRLACSLSEARQVVRLEPGTRLAAIYGVSELEEGFNCNFGFNQQFAALLMDDDLTVSARAENGDWRAFELRRHPFFMATLFQPERSANSGQGHSLIRAFVTAAKHKAAT
jgi:CTP synthase (UTP-ammonia lyase)